MRPTNGQLGRPHAVVTSPTVHRVRAVPDLKLAATNCSPEGGDLSGDAREIAAEEWTGRWRIARKECVSWQKPCDGRLKFNVDASFDPNSDETTVGIVGRDHRGLISIAANLAIDKCRDVEEAEACAIREGFKLSLDHNLMPSSIEFDCANVVTATNKPSACASRSWGVYKDIEHLRAIVSDCEFIKTNRMCNSVAHQLARIAKSDRINKVWMPPVPLFISDLCVKDSGMNWVINE
uniref:Uncharacterized protein n=1 Tax=Avena sativa TaxID=4498 RepID=A0ACD5Y6W7_AVESA